MTGLLHDMLRERADSAAPPLVDVDQIVRTGESRVRRSRAVTGLAAAAVAGVIAAGAVVVPGLLDSADTTGQPATGAAAFTERRVGFAEQDVIHSGSETFSVGAVVAAYVQTDDGFVFVQRNGDVRLFDGAASTVVGHSQNGRVRADDTGSLVAWVDRAEDGHPQYVVYDTAARVEVARVDDNAAGASRDPGDLGAEVLALDDGSVYWNREADWVRHDLSTGEETVIARWTPPIDPETKAGRRIVDLADVADGRIAYTEENATGSWMSVGTSVGPEATRMPTGWHGVLSPDGALVGVEEADEIAVYDTGSGQDVTPDLSPYPFAVLYGWEDPTTAMVFAIKDLDDPAYPADLLSCDIASGSCDVASSLDSASDGLVLPTGDPAS